MGNKKTEGATIDATVPGGQTVVKGELYRIDGWNGIAMSTVLPTDPELGVALENDNQAIWYITIPAAVAAARGDVLYWTAGTGFKKGSTDLSATVAGPPAVKVEEAKDANNVVGVRVLNIG
jgi:hypothetical protein